MELKERIENFVQIEKELQNDLRNAIRKEFNKYKKDEVIFIPDLEYDKEIDGLCVDDFFDIATSAACPRIMDKYCQIDGTATVKKIKYENKELRLYCIAQTFDDMKYILLNKRTWGLGIGDLKGILELLQNPIIKKINEQ
ncbi:MAG: hypothetical protein J1E16_06435 [Muribaculaceae bacterium]|nr:hypothetical protein [Muribaculaceae bacterium]